MMVSEIDSQEWNCSKNSESCRYVMSWRLITTDIIIHVYINHMTAEIFAMH